MKVSLGTIRIKVKDLNPYEKTRNGWKKIKKEFPEARQAAHLFKAHRKLKAITDTKKPQFLKGQLSPKGQEQGARINILPNGEVLEKAFSLFSPHLKLHDQSSHDHWDVLYQNKGGTWSYVYTLAKRKAHRAAKYKKVHIFEKHYATLKRNVMRALHNPEDFMAVPMHTLLNTYMRIGNEMYFKAHKHKGLTTMMKKDVKISGNVVSFNYAGKDGVPITVTQKFSSSYIKRLKGLLRGKKSNDFVFSKNGHPMPEQEFKKAFTRYCGYEFYPHIVRSHYATMQVTKFLQDKSKITSDTAKKLFLSIAGKLGHKKFNKKTHQWQEHSTVTVSSYIQPELVEKVMALQEKK
jgi:hypothetical protein